MNIIGDQRSTYQRRLVDIYVKPIRDILLRFHFLLTRFCYQIVLSPFFVILHSFY